MALPLWYIESTEIYLVLSFTSRLPSGGDILFDRSSITRIGTCRQQLDRLRGQICRMRRDRSVGLNTLSEID